MFSAFLASIILLLLHLATRGRGMGLGDVKFALFGGLFFDIPKVLVWLMLSFVIGGGFGVVLLLLRKTKLGARIAFGPFMALALILMLVFGDRITFNLFVR